MKNTFAEKQRTSQRLALAVSALSAIILFAAVSHAEEVLPAPNVCSGVMDALDRAGRATSDKEMQLLVEFERRIQRQQDSIKKTATERARLYQEEDRRLQKELVKLDILAATDAKKRALADLRADLSAALKARREKVSIAVGQFTLELQSLLDSEKKLLTEVHRGLEGNIEKVRGNAETPCMQTAPMLDSGLRDALRMSAKKHFSDFREMERSIIANAKEKLTSAKKEEQDALQKAYAEFDKERRTIQQAFIATMKNN